MKNGYMAGGIPAPLKWATNLVGVSGNVQKGLAILEQAGRSQSYVRNDAKMILAYLYEREGQFQKALKHLRDLRENYPGNIIFQYNLARVMEKCHQPEKAKEIYQLILAMERPELPALRQKSRSRLERL